MTGLSDNQRAAIADLAERDVQTVVSKSFDEVIERVRDWVLQLDLGQQS